MFFISYQVNDEICADENPFNNSIELFCNSALSAMTQKVLMPQDNVLTVNTTLIVPEEQRCTVEVSFINLGRVFSVSINSGKIIYFCIKKWIIKD